MSIRYFRLCIGAFMLFGVFPAQAAVTTYCCDAAAESRYLSDLAALGNTLGTVHEGFDAAPWGPDTFSPNSIKPSVSNQGLTWTPLSTTVNSYLATSRGGGDVHDGSYLMFSVYYDIYGFLRHPSPDGFVLTGDSSTLYGVGGWYRGFDGAKVSFVVDGDPTRVDFTGAESTLSTTWKFLGFIETAGFNGLEVIEVEEAGGDETNYFWVDDFDIGITASPGNSAPELVAIEVDHSWQTVGTADVYTSPVVLCSPPTYHGTQPGVLRLRNVLNSSFDVSFQEWLYLDGIHAQESIACVLTEAGRQDLPDGSVVETGTFTLEGTGNWVAENFGAAFAGKPAVFLTVQTENGAQPVTARVRNVTTSGFETALFEEEALMDGHVPETVGYLAIFSPHGSGTMTLASGDAPYLLQRITTNHTWVPVLSHSLKLEEEQSVDSETAHIDEALDVLVLGEHLFAQVVSDNGADTIALRRLAPEYGALMEWGVVGGVTEAWTQVPLAKAYANPVVVAKPVSSSGAQQGVIRMQGVSPDAFSLRYQEWNYLDGLHVDEQVFYMAAEAGSQSVVGLQLMAGKSNTNALARAGDWEPVSFSAPFGAPPAVFAAVTTSNGIDAVTTRLRAIDAQGFDLAMDEQESKSDGHVTETIDWIAIAQGNGTTPDGRQVTVFTDQVNDSPAPVPYGIFTNRRYPVVLSDVISTYGTDPVFLRYRNATASDVELYLQEEQSADVETSHVLEDVSVLVAE